MPPDGSLPPELDYVLLLFALFVFPRMLQRYRLPAAVTSVALGAAASIGLGLFTDDLTVSLLATLGIVALFLFAGLEVDFVELRREARVLVQHLVIGAAALAVTAILVQVVLGLSWRPAVLVALALLTPSTGFILDSLPSLGVSDLERFWVKSKAIATELVALAVMFVTLQSTTTRRLFLSTLVLAAMILLLPVLFRVFAARVVPYAPKSEFAFLLMLAVLCAFVTRRLGVYYLVGAFVVGIAAQTFRRQLPAIASDRTLHAVEVFASFFVPFYFFSAGLQLRAEDFAVEALLVGGGFLATMIPLRVALVLLHRRAVLGETLRAGMRIGAAMLPSLVFTLVIAAILRDTFAVPRPIFGGLIIYTLANTLVPGFALRLPAAEPDIWHAEWEPKQQDEQPDRSSSAP
ncbi:MAG: cation:proton antiporter [Gemmatimonadetes bacterium]|nr:cation:proton antiporter [Gemmatimonadota bacterium]